MKNLYILLFMICSVCSCKSPEPIIDNPASTGRDIETRITFTGDIEIGEPLPMFLKVTPGEHIYGVQIYTRSFTPSTSAYKPFAYGLFDDLSKVVVELPDNMLYRVCVTMVANGKQRVEANQGDYYEPFAVGTRFFPINNIFAYSSSTALTGIFVGRTALRDASNFGYTTHNRPNIDRYSGETIDFQPRENLNIEVELRRVVFGIRLLAVGLKEGYVELSIEDAPSMRIYPGQDKVEEIFTLKGSGTANVWIDDNYTETVICKAKWVKGDKSEITLGPSIGKALVLKRKQMYPVSTRVVWDAVGGDITMEDGTLIDQEETIF